VAGVRLNNNTAITYQANKDFFPENWLAKLWLE
jgi:hypothetical protein